MGRSDTAWKLHGRHLQGWVQSKQHAFEQYNNWKLRSKWVSQAFNQSHPVHIAALPGEWRWPSILLDLRGTMGKFIQKRTSMLSNCDTLLCKRCCPRWTRRKRVVLAVQGKHSPQYHFGLQALWECERHYSTWRRRYRRSIHFRSL